MFALFADVDSLNPENALASSNFWTWFLLIAFFMVGFVYNGLVWAILLRLIGLDKFSLKIKFYYSILAITFLTAIFDFIFLFIFGKPGIVAATIVMFIINLAAAKFVWKLSTRQVISLATIATLLTAPWLIFLVK